MNISPLLLFFLSAAVILLAGFAGIMFYNWSALKKTVDKISAENDNLENELDRIKEELHITRVKAGESDRLKSAFLCNMSHEIRTPLHAIMGFCGLIANAAISGTDKVNYANIINRNVDSMLDLVNDIFDISQVEAGITKVADEAVKVNELLGSIQTWLNVEKAHSGKEYLQVRLSRANKDNDFTIYSDGYKLRRTLNNLAGNAIKYSNEGYIDLGYRFGDNNMIEFYVKDEGIGFSSDKLDIIFQQFRQLDESMTRQYGGIGLGLNLAKKFVEMLGGTLWAESEPGAGSTFWFSLPYRKSEKQLEPVNIQE